jgi:23S rRNA G2445 N2-methylase RlmL
VTEPVSIPRRIRWWVHGLAAALLLAVVMFAALQLRGWRDREREARLREIHTLTGTVERHPASSRSTSA